MEGVFSTLWKRQYPFPLRILHTVKPGAGTQAHEGPESPIPLVGHKSSYSWWEEAGRALGMATGCAHGRSTQTALPCTRPQCCTRAGAPEFMCVHVPCNSCMHRYIAQLYPIPRDSGCPAAVPGLRKHFPVGQQGVQRRKSRAVAPSSQQGSAPCPSAGQDSRTSHRGSGLAGTPSRPCSGGRCRRPCGSGTAAWHPCNPSARHTLQKQGRASVPDGHTGLTLSRELSPG